MAEPHENETTQEQGRERRETERRIREVEQRQKDHADYGKKMREKLAVREEEKILKK